MQSCSAGATPYKGVRDARFVEALSLMKGVEFSHDVTGLSLPDAGVAYDLVLEYARQHANKERSDGEPLNLQKLVDEKASLVGPIREFLIGFLGKFVLDHPLEIDGAHPNEWVEILKHQLVPLARLASLELQERIAEVTFCAGRQRMDASQIIPAIEEADPALENVKNDDEDQGHRATMLMLCAPPGSPDPEEPLTNLNRHFLGEIKRLETEIESMKIRFASSTEAKNAEFKASLEVKDDEIAFLKNELRTGFIRITLRSRISFLVDRCEEENTWFFTK